MKEEELEFLGMAEMERPVDADRVSKREIIERNVELRKHCAYLVLELFKSDAGHRYFENLSNDDRARLVRLKLCGV